MGQYTPLDQVLTFVDELDTWRAFVIENTSSFPIMMGKIEETIPRMERHALIEEGMVTLLMCVIGNMNFLLATNFIMQRPLRIA